MSMALGTDINRRFMVRLLHRLGMDSVIPAQAGIQGACENLLDSCLRRNDKVNFGSRKSIVDVDLPITVKCVQRLANSHFWFTLAFFTLYYIYLWRVIDPSLIYHGFGTIVRDVPVYSTGWQFFLDAFDVPGGFVLYCYGFLSQWFYYSWLGALIVTFIALTLCKLIRRHLRRANQPCPTVIYVLPAVIILWIYNQYNHPLAACLTLIVGLILSYVLEALPVHRVAIRMVVLGFFIALGYWLAGTGAVLVLAMMTTIHLLTTKRQWLWAIVPLPLSVMIVWGLAEYVFFISPKQAFLQMTPFWPQWTEGVQVVSNVFIVTLYALVPAVVLLMSLGKIVYNTYQRRVTAQSKKSTNKKPRVSYLVYIKKFVGPVLLLVILALGLSLTNDQAHRDIVQMNALSRQGRWSDVLELGRHLSKDTYDINCNHDINRALYRTDRLGYDLLCFQQNPHALLLTHDPGNSSVIQLKMCATFMELGNVDLAEKLASEFLVGEGQLGVVLEKLAWINIIKGQPETARVYLNVLAKNPIQGVRAQKMLDGLENGFGSGETAYINYINACIPKCQDGRLSKNSVEEMLTGLLAQNAQNKMAFEYLMASYLLAGRLDGIIDNVERVKALGYREIPTLYEEALLIYHGAQRQRLDLKRFPIKRQTLERYKRFVQLDSAMKGTNSQAVFQQMFNEFGSSYFFYYRFAIAGQAGKS